jgi:phage shock protein A
MTRGVPGSGKKASLSDPAVRAKAEATRKQNAGKNGIKKLLGRLQSIDLAPIDDQIADLETQITALKTLRSQVQAMRNPTATAAQATETASAVPSSTPAAMLPALKVRIRKYLESAGVAKEHTIAADLRAMAGDVVQALRADDCFTQTREGWMLSVDQDADR